MAVLVCIPTNSVRGFPLLHTLSSIYCLYHSSILVWRIPWTEEPGGPPSMGLQRVGHDCGLTLSLYVCSYTLVCFVYICGSEEAAGRDWRDKLMQFPISQTLTKLALWFLHLMWLSIHQQDRLSLQFLIFSTYWYSNSTWSFLKNGCWIDSMFDFNDLKTSLPGGIFR